MCVCVGEFRAGVWQERQLVLAVVTVCSTSLLRQPDYHQVVVFSLLSSFWRSTLLLPRCRTQGCDVTVVSCRVAAPPQPLAPWLRQPLLAPSQDVAVRSEPSVSLRPLS